MPFFGNLEHLTLPHRNPYIHPTWQPATTCDPPFPPSLRQLSAAHDNSQPLLPLLQLLPLLRSLRHLAIAPPSSLISDTLWQLPVARHGALSSLISDIPMQPIIPHDNPTLSHHFCHLLAASGDPSHPLMPTIGEQPTITLHSRTHCPLSCSSRTTFDCLQQPPPFPKFYNI